MTQAMRDFEKALNEYADCVMGMRKGLNDSHIVKARAAVLALHAAALAANEAASKVRSGLVQRVFDLERELDAALARAAEAEMQRDAAHFDSCFYKAEISAVAIKLRERAAKELHQPRGHDMDAREWACVVLEGAAEEIEVNYPRKPERPAESPASTREAFEDFMGMSGPDGWPPSPWSAKEYLVAFRAGWQAALASRPTSEPVGVDERFAAALDRFENAANEFGHIEVEHSRECATIHDYRTALAKEEAARADVLALYKEQVGHVERIKRAADQHFMRAEAASRPTGEKSDGN